MSWIPFSEKVSANARAEARLEGNVAIGGVGEGEGRRDLLPQLDWGGMTVREYRKSTTVVAAERRNPVISTRRGDSSRKQSRRNRQESTLLTTSLTGLGEGQRTSEPQEIIGLKLQNSPHAEMRPTPRRTRSSQNVLCLWPRSSGYGRSQRGSVECSRVLSHASVVPPGSSAAPQHGNWKRPCSVSVGRAPACPAPRERAPSLCRHTPPCNCSFSRRRPRLSPRPPLRSSRVAPAPPSAGVIR